jgi:hypothetical protein
MCGNLATCSLLDAQIPVLKERPQAAFKNGVFGMGCNETVLGHWVVPSG